MTDQEQKEIDCLPKRLKILGYGREENDLDVYGYHQDERRWKNNWGGSYTHKLYACPEHLHKKLKEFFTPVPPNKEIFKRILAL